MSHQIFRKDIPDSLIFKFFENSSCQKNDKYYQIDNIFFKKIIFNNLLESFLKELEDYYHISKKFYLNRKMTYTKFMTIIRQICKKNEIPFTSKILYDKSSYNIIYFIYHKKD